MEKLGTIPDQKWMLDLAHFAKIEESDGVVMLNIENYLGESSTRELLWARMRNKTIFWTLNDERKFQTEFFASKLIYGHQYAGTNWLDLIDLIERK